MPSLDGLQVFEAAARHLSFTRAAAELNVTQTAVSHRIRRLEEQLDQRLFLRRNRGRHLELAHLVHVRVVVLEVVRVLDALGVRGVPF